MFFALAVILVFAWLLGFTLVPRVHEDTATGKDAMHIRHHTGNPAHIEVLAAWAFFALQAFVDVALHGGCPVAHIAHVDRKFLGVFRNLDVLLGQYKRALFSV